ncbi:MAG: hypothetical protein CMO44_18040 [Verrucomicrobiales bacterium]|nr:hypothetical protein [Verrucomicrobiales bacterium]|tara:strand:+ start:336 stop:551 length:216 start_codon:yes stop_codon:yes gene_type:complete
MNFSIIELAVIGNLWIRHLEETDILDATWGLCVIEEGDKLSYTSNGLSLILLEGLMEEHMLTYIHYLTLNI